MVYTIQNIKDALSFYIDDCSYEKKDIANESKKTQASLNTHTCETFSFKLSDPKKDLLAQYLLQVLNKNNEVKLTSITNINEAVKFHLIDSLFGLDLVNQQNSNICDLGCGPGFPGIIFVACTQNKMLFLDSINKKINCVNSFLQKLNLEEQAEAVCARSETFAGNSPKGFDYVVSRAVASLSQVLELATPLLKSKGKIVLYRGFSPIKKLVGFKEIYDVLGIRLASVRHYALETDNLRRSIVVFEKITEPKMILPRREGMVKKHPLSQKFKLEDF